MLMKNESILFNFGSFFAKPKLWPLSPLFITRYFREQLQEMIRQWFIECRDQSGKFPDYPSEEDGGSAKLFTEKTPEELEAELKAKEAEKEAKGKKGKKDKKEKKEKKGRVINLEYISKFTKEKRRKRKVLHSMIKTLVISPLHETIERKWTNHWIFIIIEARLKFQIKYFMLEKFKHVFR